MDVGGEGVIASIQQDLIVDMKRSRIISKPGDSIVIPLKITHPNVSVSVYRQTKEKRFEPNDEFLKVHTIIVNIE